MPLQTTTQKLEPGIVTILECDKDKDKNKEEKQKVSNSYSKFNMILFVCTETFSIETTFFVSLELAKDNILKLFFKVMP